MNDPRRIDRILRIRTRIRDAVRSDLAHARARQSDAEVELSTAADRERGAVRELSKMTDRSVEEIALHAAGVTAAVRSIRDARQTLAARNSDVSDHVTQVQSAQRDVSALECLRARVAAGERRRELRADQELSDEIATRSGGIK